MNKASIACTIYRHSGFAAHYLGAVSMFMMQPGNRRSLEAQLVSKIEEEQLDGKLKLKPSAADAVRLRLDRHGFQVACVFFSYFISVNLLLSPL